MDLVRQNKRAFTAIGAGLALIVLVLLMTFLHNRAGERGGTVIGNPSAAGLPGAVDAPASTGPASGPKHHARKAKPSANALSGLPAVGAGNPVDLPGMQGRGFSVSLPKVPIVLRVTSSAPIGTVGYLVPTSPDKNYGVVKNVGRSWILRTYGYGKPDYARIFVQAGPTGAVITCTVEAKGRVTDQRSTSGPYGRTMCQG
jgi:hypothetical protein